MTGKQIAYRQGHSAGSLLTFALLGIFAVLSLFAVIASARVYHKVADTADENYRVRTAMTYVAGKVRKADQSGKIAVQEHDGVRVLTLREEINGAQFETYIYYADGGICEYFGRSGQTFSSAYGEKIVDADGFFASIDDDCLTVSVTDAENLEHSLTLYLQCGAEAEG